MAIGSRVWLPQPCDSPLTCGGTASWPYGQNRAQVWQCGRSRGGHGPVMSPPAAGSRTGSRGPAPVGYPSTVALVRTGAADLSR